MYSIDEALRLYTDYVNGDTGINIEEIKKGLSETDLSEFNELTPIIDLVGSLAETKKFDELFEKINEEKERIYSYETASGFRCSDDIDKDTKDTIDKAFKDDSPND